MPSSGRDWTERLGSPAFVILTSIGWILLGYVLGKGNDVLIVAMVVIMGIAGLLWLASFDSAIAFRRARFHYDRKKHRREPEMADESFGIVYTPGPDSPSRSLTIRDVTRNREDYFIYSGYRPSTVEFRKPVMPPTPESQLPMTCWIGKGKIVVSRFTPYGLVISETTSGDDFEILLHA